ncbi:B-cell receptor CD22 isoform X2 [Sphaeramia orbicularis]|uniref:B-cell receptor CD22 n=2 Tax=Sphaeramia orbicularis TaxID=375764 RepID=A0A673A1W0_9TELE|nr:B-cell receptor CD22-like isoform X2 [Sphaeramia orbicularis]
MELQLHRMMTAPTVYWLLFLGQITGVSYGNALFTISKSSLTATEGSCIEIECTVTGQIADDVSAHWFWVKDAKWNDNKGDFFGTIVYSNKNTSDHPLSPDFKDRVTYTGSPSFSSRNDPSQNTLCSIFICNLKTSDTGQYSFRYNGDKKWITKPNASLTVNENECLVSFNKPEAVIESGWISLICSTSSLCSSRPQIKGVTQRTNEATYSLNTRQSNRVTDAFEATWEDDGKEFSCQIENNQDKYLVRNISITVEHAPRNTVAHTIPNDIKEGDPVTLKCSSSGRPIPTFEWFEHGTNEKKFSGSEWTIPSVQLSDAGQYYCKAHNKYGNNISNVIQLIVTYKPRVEVIVVSPQPPFIQGERVDLSCNVVTSNPLPTSYRWFKNRAQVGSRMTYVINRIEPEDSQSYTCEATNTVGTGKSRPLQMNIHYKPRNTSIIIEPQKVRKGERLTFTCKTDANPTPGTYTWYRYSNNTHLDSSLWKSKTTNENSLLLEKVQVDDEACYMCNATNSVDPGDNSQPGCVDVLYPPTNLTLTMVTDITEGQWITINCTVKSSPKSDLSLKWSSKELQKTNRNNTLRHTFQVTSAHTGNYICHAHNSEGSPQSTERKLVVKYSPKNVRVSASPGLTVNENTMLKLECSAESHPPVRSFIWLKRKDGQDVFLKEGQTLVVKPVTPSDSGRYSCKASNEIGNGTSQPVDVKVRYAPKHTEIIRLEEQQQPDGTRTVKLKCSSSRSYPEVKQYRWYMKDQHGDVKVSDQQIHTVTSDKPGLYYCIAQNEISGKMSEPEPVFMNRDFIKIIILALIILLIIVIIFFVYRHRRRKSSQQRVVNTLPWWSSVTSLGRCYGARRPEAGLALAEPSRSRDDLLLPARPCGQNGQQSQHRPDNTGASSISTIYCTVKYPTGQESSTQKPHSRHQGGRELDDFLNYASLHFDKKPKNRPQKANTEVVYAAVAKSKPLKKNESEVVTVYGNINEGHKGKPPNLLIYDTDTSEDEADISYTQVNFVAKPGCKKNTGDSSSSDEEQTQYSQVKL